MKLAFGDLDDLTERDAADAQQLRWPSCGVCGGPGSGYSTRFQGRTVPLCVGHFCDKTTHQQLLAKQSATRKPRARKRNG